MEIYLACAENPMMLKVLNWMRYPYRLCSYYHVTEKWKGKRPDSMMDGTEDGSSWIMDSGLFSFMFGAKKGLLKTYKEFYDYSMRYVDDMVNWGWKHTIVECDAQRLLGVEETYRLREDVFDKSGFEVMYVWHIPDGIEALSTEQYLSRDRIGLSVPEIRAALGSATTGGVKTKRALIRLLADCYGKGPKVHLLGNTESQLLTLQADTCDSSSWIYAVTFGKGTIFGNGRTVQVSSHSPKWEAWVDWCLENEPEAAAAIEDGYGGSDQYRWLLASAKSYQMMINHTHGDTPWILE